MNPWSVNQSGKPGLAQMIGDAWRKHCKDRELISQSHREIKQVMTAEWNQSMHKCFQENFIMRVEVSSKGAEGSTRRQTVGTVAHTQRPRDDPAKVKKGPDKGSTQPIVGEIYIQLQSKLQNRQH